MRTLSAVDLLSIWEAGFTQAPTGRALTLLAAACPETSPDALAALSIGQRDAKLLMLREGLWGSQMAAVVDCPGCRERLELPLDTRQMLSNAQGTPACEISLSVDGYSMMVRLPTSLDVIAASAQTDQAACKALIAHLCLLSAEHNGDPVDPHKLPPEVVERVVNCIAESDPLADIQLQLTCPSCDHKWHAVFDIVSFLWTEIEVWAWRALSDVHTLARAYGWRERDILALSPTRRQFYLEMVGA
jgi:hypothetical protein